MESRKSTRVAFLDIYLTSSADCIRVANELGAQFSQLHLFVSGHVPIQLYVTLFNQGQVGREEKEEKIK